jgi:hypothetical protein
MSPLTSLPRNRQTPRRRLQRRAGGADASVVFAVRALRPPAGCVVQHWMGAVPRVEPQAGWGCRPLNLRRGRCGRRSTGVCVRDRRAGSSFLGLSGPVQASSLPASQDVSRALAAAAGAFDLGVGVIEATVIICKVAVAVTGCNQPVKFFSGERCSLAIQVL